MIKMFFFLDVCVRIGKNGTNVNEWNKAGNNGKESEKDEIIDIKM